MLFKYFIRSNKNWSESIFLLDHAIFGIFKDPKNGSGSNFFCYQLTINVLKGMLLSRLCLEITSLKNSSTFESMSIELANRCDETFRSITDFWWNISKWCNKLKWCDLFWFRSAMLWLFWWDWCLWSWFLEDDDEVVEEFPMILITHRLFQI